MGINRGILAALVFLMTACGGNKAGTLTLKNNGGSPESAPITAGPTVTPTATPVPVASVTPTPSSSVTPTPTPGGGPTPSVTPTPTPPVTPTPAPVPPPASPTPNPVVTPTPPPGDWNNANNLSQAIFDIVELEPTPNHITYVISYYDIDHLGQKPADFSKVVKLSFVNTAPNQASAQFILTPNTPEFTNSSVQCQDGCKTGTIHLIYSGKAGSKLNGTADIDFIRKAIKKTQYELGLTISSDIRELKFIETLKNSKFFEGILTVFNVRNGFVQPYEVNLDFGLPADSCFSDNTILHGRKIGALKEVTYAFYAQPIPFHLSGFLGRANVSTDFSSFVELCFESPHSLKGFGAYTTSNPNPMGPCP